jgi:hypothetical protein
MTRDPALEEAILHPDLRHINFFNGRLLTGGDLEAEQSVQHAHARLLGNALGAGVAFGLEVTPAEGSPPGDPVVIVTAGVAISPAGQTLSLQCDQRIALMRPRDPASGDACVFDDCDPQGSAGTLPSGTGFYLLLISPASRPQGRAPVSGLGSGAALCNSRFLAEGVQFRLLPISVTPGTSASRTRNTVAYQCFGLPEEAPNDFLPPALGRFSPPAYGVETRVPTGRLTNSDVPLAIIQWTGSAMGYVDMWPVRRRLTKTPTDTFWEPLIGDRRLAEGEAMFLQFQDHLHRLSGASADLAAISAEDHFAFLPPLGILPVRRDNTSPGFDPARFFGVAHASSDVAMLDAAQLASLLSASFRHEPVRLDSVGKLQLYLIWESVRAAQTGGASQLTMVFANPALPYAGTARFGHARFSRSRFANSVI